MNSWSDKSRRATRRLLHPFRPSRSDPVASSQFAQHNEAVQPAEDQLAQVEQHHDGQTLPCPTCKWNGGKSFFHYREVWDLGLQRLANSRDSRKCPSCSMAAAIIHSYYPNPDIIFNRITFVPTGQIDLKGRKSHRVEKFEVFITPRDHRNADGFGGFTTRPLVPDTASSAESLDWVKWRLKQCDQLHKSCAIDKHSKMPSRVIDIAPSNDFSLPPENVKLIDQAWKLPPKKYVALSYCWGDIKPECLTTMENFDAQKKSIKFNTLPKAFKDIIIFIRSLHIRYLWIDSICIIQYSAADWAHQASLMSGVYGNSYLTIAALDGKDCEHGLFRDDDTEHTCKAVLLSGMCPEVSGSKFYARRVLPHIHSWNRDESHPLFDRAWTYQERVIAPRVLYFTRHELAWECSEHLGCECDFRTMETLNNDTNSTNRRPPKLEHSKLNTTSAVRRWRDIVAEFSQLNITYHGDRLPAVSAIAEQVHKFRPGDTYLAGLWQQTLLGDLLWMREGTVKSSRPQPNFAPTWSWASITGMATYSYFVVLDTSADFHVEVAKVSCSYIGDAKYGQASSASLTLLARTVQCSISLREDNWLLESPTGSIKYDRHSISLDSDDADTTKGVATHLIHFATGEDEMWFMLLKQVESTTGVVYHRVGLMSLYDDSEPQTREAQVFLGHLLDSVRPTTITLE